jgi:tripartite-type tricarboxylate transporter receptor subunit TctC
MKLPRRNFLHLAAAAATLPAASRIARAQAYPTLPVRMIVGFAAGGGAAPACAAAGHSGDRPPSNRGVKVSYAAGG